MSDWFWLAVLSRTCLRRPKWFFPVIAIFIAGALLAGLIYARVVFHALSERSNSPHVSTHRRTH